MLNNHYINCEVFDYIDPCHHGNVDVNENLYWGECHYYSNLFIQFFFSVHKIIFPLSNKLCFFFYTELSSLLNRRITNSYLAHSK